MANDAHKHSSSTLYRNGLGEQEKERYNEKLKLLGGIDPYEIQKWSSDVSLLPSVTYIDIVNYLLWTPSKYTKDDLKSYKGLEAYNQFINGWVRDRSVVECNGYIVVTAKVLHSQRLSEKPLRPWIVAEKSGSIAAAHCNCMAGLGEACTHIAALLFAIDATVRIRETKTVTDEKAYWLLPSDMKKISYEEVKNIDFTSAATAKRKFEQSLDNISLDIATTQTPKVLREDKIPETTEEDMNNFFSKLAQDNPTSVILSLVEPHSEKFIPRAMSQNYPKVLTELKDEKCFSMERTELLEHCVHIASTVSCDAQQRDAVKSVTREQSYSKFWNTFRSGRVTASQAKAVCTSDLDNPSASLVKRLCYPGSKTFKSQATKWGVEHEKTALRTFKTCMMETHENACLEDSGLVLSTEYPYIGASPDGIFSCDCCGQAAVEIKCPFKCRNEDLTCCDYLQTDENGERHLNVKHSYYYQLQTQLGCTKLDFCYFVVWTEKDLHIEQIAFDKDLWNTITMCAKKIFQAGILPELVGKYYSRLPSLNVSDPNDTSKCKSTKNVLTPVDTRNTTNIQDLSEDSSLYCYCRKGEFGKMIACDNQNCKYQWFHYQCVGIKRKPRGDWYCRDCLN